MTYINTMTIVSCYLRFCEDRGMVAYPEVLIDILCGDEDTISLVCYMVELGYTYEAFKVWSAEIITEDDFNSFESELHQCFVQLMK